MLWDLMSACGLFTGKLDYVTHSGLSSSVCTCNLSGFSFALLPKLFVLFEPVVAI